MTSKQIMWRFLIAKGSITESMSYYGRSADIEATERYKKTTIKMLFDSINWDETTDVVDGDEEFFLGTFCEYNDKVKDLRGTLVLKGGKETNWYLAMDDDISITECINAVLEFSENPASIFQTSE